MTSHSAPRRAQTPGAGANTRRTTPPRRTSGSRPVNRRRSGNGGGSDHPNYALRRAIVLGLLLAVLAGIVWGVVALIRALTGTEDSPQSLAQAQAQSEALAQSEAEQAVALQKAGITVPQGGSVTADGVLDSNDVITIPSCQDSALSVSLEPQTTTVGVGANVSLTVENTSPTACSFAPENIRRIVTSGDETYFDSAACAADQPTSGEEEAPALLLLPVGKQWSAEQAWDGRMYQGCAPRDTDGDGQADIAPAGTYQMRVSLSGATSGQTTAIVVE